MTSLLNVLFLTPYYHSRRGNATTARRLESSMKRTGQPIQMFSYEEEPAAKGIVLLEQADVVHALHIRRTYEWLQQAEIGISVPYVLTSGGTDINVDIQQKQQAADLEAFVRQADKITVFSRDGVNKLDHAYPELSRSIQIVPQGVDPSAAVHDENLVRWLQDHSGTPNILIPAGLRSVKDVLFGLKVLEELRVRFPAIQFLIVGEAMEEQVKREVVQAAAARSWMHYHEGVEMEAMPAFYDWADVVINTSLSEGQPMAVLEAMMHQVPVLARRNGGNESVIQDGRNGLLFGDERTFHAQLEQLLDNPDLIVRLTRQAKTDVLDRHSSDKEALQYQAIYKEISNGRKNDRTHRC